ncbi:MAG TPA: serine hydrolase [Candidatus Polarisedimenticolaceae bacterium]|nr:serine hydrolase [Candidatus Polarisedimenticolaceae bacterium]
MKRVACSFLSVVTLLTLFAFSAIAQTLPPRVAGDAEIRKILADRVDAEHQGVGIVVGVIEPAGRRVVAYGTLDAGDSRPLNGDTLFEIGSTTKVFTSLLLADMVSKGEVALTDPVSNFLPEGVKMPERNGRKITLVDLATHTSGLPRLPSNLAPRDTSNPYADYTVRQLYDFLSGYRLSRDVGSQYEYSNLGAGLLGHVLALHVGQDYETLVRTRICGPLGMKDTSVTLSDAMKKRLAVGHDAQRKPVPNWDIPTLAGAGALHSSANDLLTFLADNLGYQTTPLAPAMAIMLATRRPTGVSSMEIALGWHVTKTGDTEIVWHNGGTGGSRSWIGFDQKNRTGVVILANMFTNAGVDDIGQHLLVPSAPLVHAPREHAIAKVDPAVVARYVGRYQLAPNFILSITREGDQLFAQATGQPRLEIFPEGQQDYFFKAVDAQITFETDANNRATGLVLHQSGDHRATRIQE